jgi:hypothetical protein
MARRVPSIKYFDLLILPSPKSSLVQIIKFARNDLLSVCWWTLDTLGPLGERTVVDPSRHSARFSVILCSGGSRPSNFH